MIRLNQSVCYGWGAGFLVQLATGLAVAAALVAAQAESVRAQEATASNATTLRVATKDIEPFVFTTQASLEGFSIDLWREIAREAGLDYEYEVVNTVQDQLSSVSDGSADVAIAAITITRDREADVDFSFAYFESGLGILTQVRTSSQSPVMDALRSGQFTTALLRLVGLLLAVILIAGHVIWLLERRRNPDFPKAYLPGVWEGIWWSAVTVTTVGYGDRTPQSKLGRIFGLMWMFAGLFIIANFTASVTTQLTVQEIRRYINGPDDLYGRPVATVAGSTAQAWLIDQRIAHRSVEFVQDAYALLDAGEVQAVVYDYPVLLYYAVNLSGGTVEVAGPPFNDEKYGIAFPTGSPLREVVNQALLTLVENGVYAQVYEKWFGAEKFP